MPNINLNNPKEREEYLDALKKRELNALEKVQDAIDEFRDLFETAWADTKQGRKDQTMKQVDKRIAEKLDRLQSLLWLENKGLIRLSEKLEEMGETTCFGTRKK